ncbi:hypothetical protein [Chryseobacterium fistulae]|uniref:Uncharacterized protein n=1 Tax=Chryseobacterium fistulae TaxID=2675058 RepID=A0A6N4XME1_9FLAO|nr:hypothetical protein [Chryseobacterium fistulae]CAA7386947.1 hypothetical protein CHRY9393_01248 [Chryseobacterium fistulae]
MKGNEKLTLLTHNQVVPGSSPGGTTLKQSTYRNVGAFLFIKAVFQ